MKTRYKRIHVQWRDVMLEIGDLKMEKEYWQFKQAHKTMSDNRCAWNILKRYYSTTALAQLRFKYGEM